MKYNIHAPHDGIFKACLSDNKFAMNFFSNHLPTDILNLLDLETLQIKKGSFVEKELRQFYSDILYQVASKKGMVYIYLLFEHQSSPDKLIAFRFLRYIVKIWELELKQQPELKLLPPVIPLALYHGKAKWDIGTRLSDTIAFGDREELRLYIPDYNYILYDLSAYSDEEIKGNIMVRIFLDLLKHIFDEDLISHLKRILPLMKALSLDDRTSLEYIELIFRYIMSARDDATPERLKEIIEETISKETGGVLMTVAEQLIEKGKEEGIKDAKLEDAKKMLLKKYPIKDIADITGLPEEEIKKLKSAVTN